MKQIYTLKNLTDLERITLKVKHLINPRTLILLQGDLGTGKTTFVKKLLKQYGINEKSVKSPTFSLINIYKTKTQTFHHLDLYRLDKHDPFLFEEIKEILAEKQAIVLIEWPENMDLSEITAQKLQIFKINLTFTKDNFRNLSFYVN